MSGKKISLILYYIKYGLSFLIGWIFIVPLAYLIPKKRNLILFIGVNDGLFIDNVKYLFTYLHNVKDHNREIYFLTENKKVFNELKEKKLPVVFYPSLYGIFIMLRTSMLVVDNYWWYTNLKYYFFIKSYKIQLWHGVGFKIIGHSQLKFVNWFTRLFKKCVYILGGLYVKYDLFVSTSEFYTTNVFSKAFDYKEVIEAGYPRNDCFFMELNDMLLMGTDKEKIKKVKEFKNNGYKIVIYLPTFSRTGRDPLMDGALDIKKLDEIAGKYKILFILKFHPNPRHKYEVNELEHIIEYDNHKDVYPLLPLTDLMITDYSSIYTDYLFLDKPVVFFPYDFKHYIEKDGKFQFDYDWITPGPKCKNYDELEHEIISCIVEGKDEYKDKRREILDMAFRYKDGRTSERIWNFVKKSSGF
ncbi:MAG: CDP-glycerol glycerophosphotransferase family protein [Candidatus Eremiobacterota bacterium]